MSSAAAPAAAIGTYALGVGGGAGLGDWAGLGVGGVLLVLLFRTLWKFSGDSSELTKNYDAALDRAQADAAAARAEARIANELLLAGQRYALRAEAELRAELSDLRATIARLHNISRPE